MATVYSGEVAIGTYNRIRIQCDYSGTTANLTVQFRRTSSYTGRFYDSGATLVFNGQSKGAAYNYNGTVGTSWINLVTVNGYTISTAGGTYSWQFNNPTGGVLGCSGTITIPAQGNPPSGGYIDELRAEYNFTNQLIEFYSSSAGVSSSTALTSLKFLILKVPYTTSGLPRQEIAFTNNNSVMLNKNNSTALSGGVTILGNDLYYAGIYAANSIGDYRYNGPSVVTPCEPANITVERITDTSVTVTYATVADGGYYDKIIEYNLDNNTWATGATVSSSSATTGTFTISCLDPYKQHTVLFRVRTNAGSTSCGSINFALLKPKFYGPVFTISAITGTIPANTQVASVNWTTFCAALNSLESEYITIDNLPTSAILKRYNIGWAMEITLTDSTVIYDRAAQFDTNITSPFITKWGITIDQSHLGTSGDMPLTVTTAGDVTEKINALYGSLNSQTKKIIKYYASENGRAKLIYKEK